MDIRIACQVIRHCNDSFVFGVQMRRPHSEVAEAVNDVKSYLEQVSSGGQPILELTVTDYLIRTPDGIKTVMPFVFSAEALDSFSKRLAEVHKQEQQQERERA